MVKDLKKEKDIDRNFYDNKVNKAVEAISEFGDFEMFTDINTEIVTDVNRAVEIISDELPDFKKKEERN